ncbi:hypothetical protein C8R46DRAFT_621125 [Mycena filopes]|nr:hypothetical protein C8R46DRAFT_621125 [Mycena filopes]
MPCRPQSPPPRSPSPEVILAPLPPPVRRRTVTPARPPRLSLQSTDSRPRLDRPQRTLASTRSHGDLRQSATPGSASRGFISAPSTPSSSSFRRANKRLLSDAVPYRSPPASPTLSSPPPPVPPIPEFVLSPTDKKAVLRTPTRVPHIYLPEWEQFTIIPDLASPRKPRTPTSARAHPSAMTCSTFFALHNQNQRSNQVMAL